jgi:hypothetical protein
MDFNKMLFAEKSKLNEHVLIHWIRSSQTPLSFAPAMSFFVLGFKDLLLNLEYPQANTTLEKAVNHHCKEDLEHWQLFLEDLETMNVGQSAWGTKTTTALRQIWSNDNWRVRQATYKLMSLTFQKNSPGVRLLMIECLELAFAVFIEAVRASDSHSPEALKYFGDHHFFEEASHAQGSWIDESHQLDLNELELTPEESKVAAMIVLEVFEWFHLMFTSWYKQRAIFTSPSPAAQKEAAAVRPREA